MHDESELCGTVEEKPMYVHLSGITLPDYQGVPHYIVLMALIIVGVCSFITGSFVPASSAEKACKQSDALMQAQYHNQTAQFNLQQSQQAQLMTIQMGVIKACTEKGGTPVLGNNNISCQK